MKKRLFLNFLVLCLLLAALIPAAYAAETDPTDETIPVDERSEAVFEDPTEEDPTEETRAPGYCGEDLTWDLSGTTLTISGSGAMDDYAAGGAPWYEHRSSIETIVLSGSVTRIGSEAFSDYDKLTSADFGNSLVEIGRAAFLSCDGLTVISLPATFRLFGEDSFRDCSKLTKVSCAGSMPSFKSNCLWNGNTMTVYCPTNNPWPEKYVLELEENFHGRLQVLTADGSDPYQSAETEATEEPTEETSKPVETQPETTAPEETTEPEMTTEVTTEATEPTTEATTETTAATEDTTEVTEPEKETDSGSGSFWIPLVLLSVVLTAGILGMLILKSRRGGKYAE